jgi:hypothetical protein
LSESQTQTQEERVREALMRKADVLVRCVRRAAEEGSIDAMEAALPQLQATLTVREFPSPKRREIDDSLKTVQCAAYMRSVEALLYQAEYAAREGDQKNRNEHLSKAKDHFVKALRQGADESFRAAVEKRVKTCLMTSAPGVDQRTKDATARRLEARERSGSKSPDGKERRRALRYSAPPLNVELDGIIFETVDWSQIGLRLDGYVGRPALKTGDRVWLRLSCAGIESQEKQAARVVQVFRDKRQLALEFAEISTIVLDLITGIRRIGMVPRAR